MSSTITTLQIPMSNSLKKEAKVMAREQGFSSLQDFVRLILTKLVRNELAIHIGSKDEYIKLTPYTKKRYEKIVSDIKANRNIIEAKDAADFLKKLRS